MESDSNSEEMVLVWPPSDCSEDEYFVKEEDIDRCVTERIISDQFHDPLVSSESEQESRHACIDWDNIFKMRAPHLSNKTYVPGHQPPPRFPRLSELTTKQHNQFLRVVSKEYPNVLGAVFLGKPSHQDVQAFEAANPIYLREQGRFQKWAKTLWGRVHFQRALRPKPIVEAVYEAEFNMKALRMSAFPKYYKVAAHIPLRNPMNNCDAVIKQDLITVPLDEMADVEIPYNITKPLFAMKPYMSPMPCPNHPCLTILPSEHVLSMLSITDIHRKLATFALNNETTCIASENALKCFTQWNRHWLLPISVCETLGPDGNKVNVLVLDSEFSVHKEVAPVRTYKAFRHLLEQALIPWLEREKVREIRSVKACAALEEKQQEMLLRASPALNVSAEPSPQAVVQDVDESSDEDHLFIMETGEDIELPKRDLDPQKPVSFNAFIEEFDSPEVTCSEPTVSPIETDNEVYSCLCEGRFEYHPPRSYRKWSFMKEDTNEKFDIIIHCPHKAKSTNQEPQRDDQDEAGPSTNTASTSIESTNTACTSTACTSAASTSAASTSTACTSVASTSTKWPSTASTSTACPSTASTSTASVSYNLEDKPEELLIEPVPEYQLELGASAPLPDAVRGVGLSLALRENVSVLNVRIHGLSGEVVTVDKLTSEEFTQKHPDVKQEVTNTIYTVVTQLQDLRPGHYVLQHEPCHGSNFVLMRPCSPSDEHTLTLNFDSSKLIKMDEAQFAKTPPTLTTALLPIHKIRKMLPCAFTPHASLLAKSVKKVPPKKKAPPQALSFPNRNMRKKTIKRNKRNKPSTASNEPSGSREHE